MHAKVQRVLCFCFIFGPEQFASNVFSLRTKFLTNKTAKINNNDMKFDLSVQRDIDIVFTSGKCFPMPLDAI